MKKNNSEKLLPLIMSLFCVMLMLTTCIGAPVSIVASADKTLYSFSSTIHATFDDSFDSTNILIDSWFMDKNKFSSISTSKIMELENFVKGKTKKRYDLRYVINISLYNSQSETYLEDVQGLKKLKLKMDYIGVPVEDYCVVVYLETGKTQAQLNGYYKENSSLLSSATTEAMTYIKSTTTFVEGQEGLDITFDTQNDGVYLIFQLDTTAFDAQTLLLFVGVALSVAIVVLLIIIIIRVKKASNLKKVQEKIRSSGDSFIVHINKKNDLYEEEIKKRNITRKIPVNKGSQTAYNNANSQNAIQAKTSNLSTKVIPKLPSKMVQSKRINKGEE